MPGSLDIASISVDTLRVPTRTRPAGCCAPRAPGLSAAEAASAWSPPSTRWPTRRASRACGCCRRTAGPTCVCDVVDHSTSRSRPLPSPQGAPRGRPAAREPPRHLFILRGRPQGARPARRGDGAVQPGLEPDDAGPPGASSSAPATPPAASSQRPRSAGSPSGASARIAPAPPPQRGASDSDRDAPRRGYDTSRLPLRRARTSSAKPGAPPLDSCSPSATTPRARSTRRGPASR